MSQNQMKTRLFRIYGVRSIWHIAGSGGHTSKTLCGKELEVCTYRDEDLQLGLPISEVYENRSVCRKCRMEWLREMRNVNCR